MRLELFDNSNKMLVENVFSANPGFRYLCENLVKTLVEADLSPEQIEQLFTNIEAASMATGNNRNVIGKAADAVGNVRKALYQFVNRLGVVQGFDGAWEEFKQKVVNEHPDLSKKMAVYKNYAKRYPATQALLLAGVMTLAGVGITGVGTAAITAGVIKGLDALLKDKRLSTAVLDAAVAGGTVYTVREVASMVNNAVHPQAANATTSAAHPGAQASTGAAHPAAQASTGAAPAPTGDASAAGQPDASAAGHPDASGTQPDASAAGQPDSSGAAAQNYTVHISKQGDNLSTLAHANHVSIKELQDANPGITNPNALIAAGYHVNIPAATGHGTYDGYYGTGPDNNLGVATGRYDPYSVALAKQAQQMHDYAKLKEYVDRDLTTNSWLLSEMVGDPRGGVILTSAGVKKLFESIVEADEDTVAVDPEDRARHAARSAPAPTPNPKKTGWNLDALERGLQTVGKNLTNKITLQRLRAAWKEHYNPTDSDAIADIMLDEGVDASIIAQVYKSMKIPVPKRIKDLITPIKKDDDDKKPVRRKKRKDDDERRDDDEREERRPVPPTPVPPTPVPPTPTPPGPGGGINISNIGNPSNFGNISNVGNARQNVRVGSPGNDISSRVRNNTRVRNRTSINQNQTTNIDSFLAGLSPDQRAELLKKLSTSG